jgi:hypothetical protein
MPRPSILELNGGMQFDADVVGESHYQAALDAICGGRTEEGHEFETVATVARDDENGYDRHAVRVEIRGLLVGYLSRDDAKAFRKLLKLAGVPDVCIACPALIRGGWDRGGRDKGHYGVKLDLPPLYGRGCQKAWVEAVAAAKSATEGHQPPKCTAVAEPVPSNRNVTGVGEALYAGRRRGVITPNETPTAIPLLSWYRSLDDAEKPVALVIGTMFACFAVIMLLVVIRLLAR